MRHFLLVATLLTLLSFKGTTQQRYAQVDSVMKLWKQPVDSIPQLNNLLDSIKTWWKTDEERVRAIYVWVADHISYDYTFKVYNKEKALAGKYAVCAGYTDLLHYSFQQLGLESIYVTGDARFVTSKGSQFQYNPKQNFRHGWNAVKVNNVWQLIDATWAHQENNREDGWFFMNPRMFFLSHFPDQGESQCMDSILSKKNFYDQPIAMWDFPKMQMQSISPMSAVIKGTIGETFYFEFKSKLQVVKLFLADEAGDVVFNFKPSEGKVQSVGFNARKAMQGKFYFGFVVKEPGGLYYITAPQVLMYVFDIRSPE